MGTLNYFEFDREFLARYQNNLEVPEHVAVVGAGRWGKIICDVLVRFLPQISTIHIVAEHNYSAAEHWLHEKCKIGEQNGYQRVVVSSSLNEVLKYTQVGAAFVTRMTSHHYVTAHQLLLAGKHVLVEKPFVLRVNEAEDLVRIAKKQKLTLAVGYEYMYAWPLHHFRDMITKHLTDVREIEFVREDCPGIVKWGLRKQQDLSMNVITDLYPHILSQLFVLFGNQKISLRNMTSRDGYGQARINLLYGLTPVTISLCKEAAEARRAILVKSSTGRCLELDFTEEPGDVTLDGAPLPKDSLWASFPSSLTSEIAYFFLRIRTPGKDMPNAAENTIHFVEAQVQANSQLVAKQTQILRKWMLEDFPKTIAENILKIMRHQMVGLLLDHGLINHPKDNETLDVWIAMMLRIAYQFCRDPWTTQESILSQEGLEKDQLIRLNAAMRDSDFLQNLMVREGLAYKYWSTILPLIETGSIHAVLTNTYRFPLRLGIYAAVSCMFYCSFCGRSHGNQAAKYPQSAIWSGKEIYNKIFASMAKNGVSTLTLGGGLEPLTNPDLDNVIRDAKRYGLRVPLVSNAYMLTKNFVKRHEGLWELDLFRISLYGVDEDSYFKVTRRKGAFQVVRNNIIDFLNERNKRQSGLKLGINFIVFVNTTDQVLRLLDVIKDINTAVHSGRGVDFLTLREDFSVTETEGLTSEERRRLVDIFKEFNARRRVECPELQVDFGYALYALSEGVVGKPLAMVTHKDMYPKAYPQVSVAIDLLGDVYLYRDAAFLDRPGADRYRIGTVTKTRSLETIVRDFIESGREIPPLPGDPAMMDAFDHVVTLVIQQAKADEKTGIPFNLGPIRGRLYRSDDKTEENITYRVNYWERLSCIEKDKGGQ